MDPLLQGLEVELRAARQHDLAVDDAPLGQVLLHRRHDLREVAGERLLSAAGQLDLITVAEHDAAEAVPLGLVQEPALHAGLGGDPLDRLGEHGGQRRLQREVHPGIMPS